jgi:hypothetical protein
MTRKHCLRALMTVTSLGIVAAGCSTSLNVKKVASEAVQGQVYYLPRVEHVITVERELIQCRTDEAELSWLREEADNLSKLDVALRSVALLKKHPACPAHQDAIQAKVGSTFQELLEKAKPLNDPCNGTQPAIEEAFAPARTFWLEKVQRDTAMPERFRKATGAARTISDFVQAVNGILQAEVVLKVAVRATATPHFLPDLSRAYVIDYRLARDAFKKTVYSVTKYPNGTLKSVNVTLEDQSGQAIVSTLKGLTNLAAMAGGFPLPAVAAAEGAGDLRGPRSFSDWQADRRRANKPSLDLCKAPALLRLDRAKNLEAGVERLAEAIRTADKAVLAATALVEEVEVELAAAKARLEKLPPGHADIPALNVTIGTLAAKVVTLGGGVAGAKRDRKAQDDALKLAEADLLKVKSQLTLRSPIHFAVDRNAQEAEILGRKEAAEEWLDRDVVTRHCNTNVLRCDNETLDAAGNRILLPTALRTYAAAYLSKPSAGQLPSEAEPAEGIVYREPASGLLMVCREDKCLDANLKISADPGKVVFSAAMAFPQLGVIAALPLKNGAFQDNTLVASFSETGSLTELDYDSNARAAAAADTFRDSAASLMEYSEAKRGATAAKLETKKKEVEAEKALLEAQLAREQAQQNLEKFRAGEPVEAEEEAGGEAGEGEGNGG